MIRLLDDPLLDDLIERAAAGNLDLKRTVDGILVARAARGIATSQFFPELDGTGIVGAG